jgi:hypothetical protein
MMTTRLLSTRSLLVAILLTLLSTPSFAQSPAASVRGDDLSALAGTWRGLVQGAPSLGEEFVEITIDANGGYEALAFRQIGVFRSRGQIHREGDHLRYQSDRGQGVMQLAQSSDGASVLRLEGTLPPLGAITADLTRKEPQSGRK